MKKRNLVSLILVLLIVNCFVISACAAHVTDDARLFSDQERAYLEQRAAEISEKYNFGVYIVTLDNYLNYHGSSNIEKFTMNYYDENGFGYGDDKAGTTLLLSMAERDYDLDFNSDRANEIFTYSGREQMKSRFLAYFRQNDFYGGFDEYLSTCEEYLQAAADGTPVGASDGVPDVDCADSRCNCSHSGRCAYQHSHAFGQKETGRRCLPRAGQSGHPAAVRYVPASLRYPHTQGNRILQLKQRFPQLFLRQSFRQQRKILKNHSKGVRHSPDPFLAAVPPDNNATNMVRIR